MKALLYLESYIILLLFVLTASHQGWGQAGSTNVSVKVIKCYQGQDAAGIADGWNEYRWKFWYKNDIKSACLQKHAKDPGWFDFNQTVFYLKEEKFIPGYNSSNPSLYIEMESWEEDEGDNCSYDSGDEIHYGPNKTIAIYNLYDEQPPGTTTAATMRKAFTYNTNNKVTYEFFYTPPQPSKPSVSGSGIRCATSSITLSSSTYVNSKFHDQVQLNWEYWIEGDYKSVSKPNPAYCEDDCDVFPRSCCYQPEYLYENEENWQSLGSTMANTNQGEISFKLNSLSGLKNLTKREKVYFRVRLYSNGSYGVYSDETGDVTAIEVDPPGPVFTATATKASCSAKPTGEIELIVSSGEGSYSGQIYRIGDADAEPIDHFEGSSKTLTVKPGTYEIRLNHVKNNAPNLSVCDITRTVKVGTIAGISWHSDTKRTNPTCPGGKGSINVRVSGGLSSEAITFSIEPKKGIPNPSSSHASKYTDLPPGSYTVKAKDPCSGQEITKAFTITAPKAVTITTTETQPTCSNPNNGKIKVTVTDGPGKYDYELWKGGKRIKAKSNTTSKSHTFNELSTGTYTVKVYDDARRSCGSVDETVEFSFNALSISSTTIKDIDCAGGTGTVTVKGSGGIGSYSYTLAHSSGKYTQTNTNGNFTVDRGGSYTITLKNSESECKNFITRNITVNEPALLSLAIEQQDITCSGIYNGKLTASVSGGTAPYSYRWQERDHTTQSWSNFGGTGRGTSTISKLYDARYRLIVTDANNCSITSTEYVLTDPDELVFENVDITQITCQGADNGRMAPTASGGWGGFTYQYRQEGETSYLHFTETTLFPPGTYQVQVTDQEGCSATYPEEITIHEPSEPLTLSYQISDYDGYALACFDGNDGWIEALPTGGNDHSFGNTYHYALNGGTFTTESRFTDLPRGTYQLSVRDERGCTVTQTIILTAPEELTLATNDKNYIQCYGDSTGYLDVLAEGGVPPYRYRMDTGNWQDETLFTVLPARDYMFIVEDSRGCQDKLNETIATNDSLAITFDKKDVQCYGLDNGTITATGSGGKKPYQFSWGQAGRQAITATNATISNLAPGWYTLTLTDAEGCIQVDSTLIEEPEAAQVTVPMVTPVRCFGEDNGQIALPTGGGTPPYRYSLDEGTTFQKDSLFTDLAPGTYATLTVDSRGCTFSSEVTVLEPDLLEIALVAQTDVLCHGDSTGSIQVQATGGTRSYHYSSNGTVWQESPDFTKLPTDKYTISVRDDRGCETSLSTMLIEPEAPLQLDYTVVPVQCKGSATGSIQTLVQGGTAPYTYQWTGLTAATDTLTNLLAGRYELIITDAQDCQLVDTIMVSEPEIVLQGKITAHQNVSCFGLSDGSVAIAAQGGYPPYQYSWQGRAFSAAQAYAKLAEGVYQMTIRDSMNCQVNMDISITQPDTLKATPEIVQHVQCQGNSDAQFQAVVSGGTQPYQYSLDAGVTWQSAPLFMGYPIGEYTILVQDSRGCQASTSLTVTEPELLTATLNDVVDAACKQANGEAKVTALGGTPPYRYSWVNSQNETISEEAHPVNLRASVYDVFVVDANGCQIQLTQIINDLDGPISEIITQQDASCFTSADGSATVAATGGNRAYRYQWSDSLAQTTATATNLARGEYFVTVTDQRGCVSISPVTIGSPEAFRLDTLTWQPPSCYEACDGTIEVAISGGVAPYSYQWEDRSETGLLLTELCRGEYSLTLTDAVGCTLTQQFQLTPPDSLQLSVTQNQSPSCYLGCDGLAAIEVSGGTAPYQYQWEDAAGGHLAGQKMAYAENLCAGTYTVTVTDAQGCHQQQQIVIEETLRMPVHLPDTVTLCLNQSVVLDATIPLGQYTWTRNGEEYSSESSLTLDQAGLYQVVVINERGCQEILQTRIMSYDTLFEVNFLQSSELYTGDTLTLTEVCFPLPDSVAWNYAAEGILLTSSQWEPQITFEEAGTYEVTLIGYYSVCTDSITKTVAFFPPQESLPSNGKVAVGPQGINMIEIYPNPTTGLFQVDVSLYSETELFAFLTDTQGQQIAREKRKGGTTYTFTFDLHGYASGSYYLRLMTEYDKKVARILVR
jgi:uncharacterized protein (DUF2141 family)